MKQKKDSAIFYILDGYNTQGQRLLGRQSAGEGFLKAYMQSYQGDTVYCHSDNEKEYHNFQQTIVPWLAKPLNTKLITRKESYKLAEIGNLYIPEPGLAEFAWQRRFYDQRGYSICGVTHTISSNKAIENIANLLTAPIQPWDALICTSNAVKTAVDKILYDWGEYLGQRFNCTINLDLQLPVIPLGVEGEKFKFNSEYRQTIRERLNIGEDDIVILFLGRLIFYAKAHPVPMYLALEKAVKQMNHKGKIYLIQCGWFEEQREEASFKEASLKFAPSINHIFLNGKNPEIRQKIWSSADIFISLSDNIQETFGLTPIEAMAAGLPVIVSDWDGYKESVRHEIDGFRISTVMPPPNYAPDLSHDYLIDKINYSMFIAHACFATMVNIDECASALVKLIDNPELRKKMGENGQQRVKEIYEWRNIIQSYQELWAELAEIRNINQMSVPVKNNAPSYPLCDDPFSLFTHYSTNHLLPDTKLKLSSMAEESSLQTIRTVWITNFGTNDRLPNSIIDEIIDYIRKNESLTLAEIISKYQTIDQILLTRTLMYLLKFDILAIY